MAVSGHNGNNETLIGMSTSLGLSLYNYETSLEINVFESKSSIEMIIPRDKRVSNLKFQYVNTTNFSFISGSFYLQNNFNITTTNASFHIELKPLDMSLGYIVVIKFGYIPIINSTYADYSTFKLMCPSKHKFIIFLKIRVLLKSH